MGRKLRVVSRGGGADAPDSSSDVDYDKLIADMDDVVYSSLSEEGESDPDEAGPSSSRRAEKKSISRRLGRLERMMTAVGLAVVNDRRKKGSKKK